MLVIVFEISEERGGNIEFDELTKAIVWVQEEVERWGRLVKEIRLQGHNTPLTSILASWISVGESLKKFRNSSSATGLQNSLKIDRNDFDLVQYSSDIGQILSFIAKKVGAVAADNAASSLGIGGGSINWNDQNAVAGLVAFQYLLNDMNSAADDARKISLNQLDKNSKEIFDKLKKIDRNADRLSKRSEEYVGQLDDKISKFDLLIEDRLRSVENRIDSRDEIISQHIEDIEARFDGIRSDIKEKDEIVNQSIEKSVEAAQERVAAWVAAQMEQTRLEAPVKLWEGRASTHRDRSDKLKIWSIAIGIFGFVSTGVIVVLSYALSEWMFSKASSAFDKVVENSSAMVEIPALRPTFQHELVLTGFITFLWVTLFIWMMRILIRRYSAEDHLAIDASARAAMTQTYLGLIMEGGASEQERAIVLGSIFRPVSERPNTEEGPPALSISALAAAMVSGKPNG